MPENKNGNKLKNYSHINCMYKHKHVEQTQHIEQEQLNKLWDYEQGVLGSTIHTGLA